MGLTKWPLPYRALIVSVGSVIIGLSVFAFVERLFNDQSQTDVGVYAECSVESIPSSKIWTYTPGSAPSSGPIIRGVLGTQEGQWPDVNGRPPQGVRCFVSNLGTKSLTNVKVTFPIAFQELGDSSNPEKLRTEPAIEIPTLLEPGKANGFTFYIVHPGGTDMLHVHSATKATASVIDGNGTPISVRVTSLELRRTIKQLAIMYPNQVAGQS